MARTSAVSALADRVALDAWAVATCARAGLLKPDPPRRLVAIARAAKAYGPIAAMPTIGALRHPDRPAIADELGLLTFAEMDDRANRLANALRARGVRSGDVVGVLARNHRGFFDATFALARCGARTVYLNTDFAGPQLRDVTVREGARLLICDEEFLPVTEGLELPLGIVTAWTDAPEPGADTLAQLIALGSSAPPPAPAEEGTSVILTSGTTGTPKGAQRESSSPLRPLAALLSKVPFRSGEPMVVGPPVFHSLGLASSMLGFSMGSTVVLRRRFTPDGILDDLAEHRAASLVLVPVMLNRVLAHEPTPRAGRDLSALRIIFMGGSQLGAELCERALAAFGPVVYNLYGSTECAYATIATPDDLRVEPGCVGAPPRGTRVRLFDADDRPVEEAGQTGRIFVSNGVEFDGYTDGSGKPVIDGMISSGDVGHFDAAGRLFIDGRDDEMIVSGGENLFPREIEELLARHPAIVEAAAVGVDDPEWGKRLRAFVVLEPGEQLGEDDVKTYVRDNLARYKVPREVFFLDELPRNPTGKVLKRALVEAPSVT